MEKDINIEEVFSTYKKNIRENGEYKLPKEIELKLEKEAEERRRRLEVTPEQVNMRFYT